MRQTTNYQLPSWDSDDRILRTDFNDLTEKTDAAIAAVKDAILCVKLVDYTAPAETAQINVDVSRIDFTQYSRIDFCLEHTLTMESARPQLLVNGLTSGYATYASGNKGASNCLVLFDTPSNSYGAYGVLNGIIVFNPPVRGSAVQCLFAFGGSPLIAYAPVKGEELRQLNLLCSLGTFPAGTRVIVTGVKK